MRWLKMNNDVKDLFEVLYNLWVDETNNCFK